MKKYQIIYADPPWNLKMGLSRTNTDSPKGRWEGYGNIHSVPYNTMTLAEIEALPVKQIAETNSVLFLWTINKFLEQSYQVARAWGFKSSTMLVWCKKPMGLGMGGAFVQTTEYLLFARRGTVKSTKRIDTTWFEHKRGRHSRKPDAFRDRIVDVFGDLSRIELFARQKTPGWDVWGNEVDSDIELSQKENPRGTGQIRTTRISRHSERRRLNECGRNNG